MYASSYAHISRFYRATAGNATHGIAVAILSVRLSVCLSVRPSDECIVTQTKQRTADISIPHETAITLVFWHQQRLVGDVPFPVKYSPKVTHLPSKNTDFDSRHISAYNVSTVRDSEKSSITTNRKSTTSFPTSHTRSAYFTPKSPKGWLKDRLRRCQLSSAVNVINIWWSGAMLITSTVEICIQQLGRVEEIVWLPYDACLSAERRLLWESLKGS